MKPVDCCHLKKYTDAGLSSTNRLGIICFLIWIRSMVQNLGMRFWYYWLFTTRIGQWIYRWCTISKWITKVTVKQAGRCLHGWCSELKFESDRSCRSKSLLSTLKWLMLRQRSDLAVSVWFSGSRTLRGGCDLDPKIKKNHAWSAWKMSRIRKWVISVEKIK